MGDRFRVHVTVLRSETVDGLAVRPGGMYVDATLGAGGHAEEILRRAGGQCRVLGIDRDEQMLAAARMRLAPWGGACEFAQGNFADLAVLATEHGIAAADGVVLDLGFCSAQVDDPERGFSFMREGPLDMRMDRNQSLTAADIVNGWPVAELADVLFQFGEERLARRIARRIETERAAAPIRTTARLAEIVAQAVGGVRGRIHPATRTFQALRIAVNDELGSLQRGLAAALSLLRPGGRLAVISFHSLEDRIVKEFSKTHAGRWVSLEQGGARWEGAAPPVRIVTRKPLMAAAGEQRENPRARSAKLRVMERVDSSGEMA